MPLFKKWLNTPIERKILALVRKNIKKIRTINA